jgi:hypothetical protein
MKTLDYKDADLSIRAHNQHSGSEALHTWEFPDWSILDDRRGELPDFPLDCLGAPVREWVERAARGAGVTPAHVAVPLLGIASSLIGMARCAKASKSWTQPMTCWTAVVGASGTGKTPGIDTIKRALAQVDRDNRSKIADLQRKHEEKAGLAKATRTKWNKEAEEAIAANGAPPPMPPEAMELGKFVAPQLYVTNSTVERLGELLQARPQGILQLMDELAALFMNMSRYSGGQDNEFWLEAWNGGSYNVQRVSRPPLHIRSKGPRSAAGYGPHRTIYLTGIDATGKVAEGFRAQGVFRVRMRSHRQALKSIEPVKIRRSGRSEWMWRLAAGAGSAPGVRKTPRKGLTENPRHGSAALSSRTRLRCEAGQTVAAGGSIQKDSGLPQGLAGCTMAR